MCKKLCVLPAILFYLFIYASPPGNKDFRGINNRNSTAPNDSIGFSGSTVFCQGESLLLTANFAPTGSTYQWQSSTDNGNSWKNIGLNTSTYTATTIGLYSVIITTDGIPANWPRLNIIVYQKPTANFTFTPNNVCSSQPVNFTNTSTGTTLTYVWNFGDPVSGSNNVSTIANPVHHFVGAHPGGNQIFPVTLIVTNGSGCKDTIVQNVNINSPGTLLGGTGFLIYNNLPYFTQCASAANPFTFTNQSSTSGTNQGYVIVWGDGSPDFTSSGFPTVNHTYAIGTYNLQFIVTGQSGCRDTANYYVYVGSNPAVGLNNPGNTYICSGTSLTFPVSGTTNNPPGTNYTITFNDGSPAIKYIHPAPASVTHLFTLGSCGTLSPGFPNSFQATIQAENPCGTSAASVVPIYVSQRTSAQFSIQPRDTVCVNRTVTFTNTTSATNGVSPNGQCSGGKGIWQITPATGWTVVSGSLGNDFGLSDPSVWQNGSTVLGLNFTTPGSYSIKLKTGSGSICANDSVTKTICVNPEPVAAFGVNTNQGCAPLIVTTTNNSNSPLCGGNTYQWTVSYSNTSGCTPSTSNYSYLNGTTATSAAPQFQFNNPGVYTVTLVTSNSAGVCTSQPVSQTITVKAKPVINLNVPAGICQNTTVNPTAIVNNCYSNVAASYVWSFSGGNPSSSTQPLPGPIQYNTAGAYTITLTVTNECGTTTVTRPLNVTPAPDVTVPGNLALCAGISTGPITFSSAITGATFTWTNSNTAVGLGASGTGNIPGFIATNTGASPITAIIAVTPSTGCAGPSSSFTITVNPRPSAVAAITPVVYCLNETPLPLNATPSPGNTLWWFTSPALTGGTTTAPVPSTSTAGTTTWYVTQQNSSNCESPAVQVMVTVLPSIGNNIISAGQIICTGTTPTSLSGTTVTGGNGTYTYQWQSSPDGTNWANIPGATSAGYAPGSSSVTIYYRRIVSSKSCLDMSQAIMITVQGSLTNIAIAAPQTICEGTAPALLTGQAPTGGSGTFTYEWERSPNGTAWTVIPGAIAIDYQPPVLTATTYYRRKTSSGSCSSYSSSLMITVNPKPVITSITDAVFCNGAMVNNIIFNSTPSSNVSYAWTNSNTTIGLGVAGSGNLPVFTASNTTIPKIPVSGSIEVIPTYTNNAISCAGNPLSFNIIVLPVIAIAAIPDTTLCTRLPIPALTPAHDADLFTGSSVDYRWTVTGAGITLINGTGSSIPAYMTANPGTIDLVSVITVTPQYTYGGKTCSGVPRSYNVTVKPGTPPANAGRDTALCNLTSYTMQASLPPSVNGMWLQTGGPTVAVSDLASPSAILTGLSGGNTYTFTWTLTGFASCSSTRDTVVVRVNPELINTIDNNTQTLCAGQSITISGNTPLGGNGTYQYQWQSSPDGTTWANITGANSPDLVLAPAQTIYVRRIVRSLPCFNESQATQIIVQPAISSNTITADQQVCINTAASTLIGSMPIGGNNIFSYQWQSSADGIFWTSIPAAINQNYAPGVLAVTTYYRRLVNTNLCSGPQASASNTVLITVRPDAHAFFNPSPVNGCVPFVLTPSIINLTPFPSQNSNYWWYADNILIGSGQNFPGYTITQSDDTVVIKMIAISAFGCRNDSISHTFYTYKIPNPSFAISDTVGCGPLPVTISNTTPDAMQFNFEWNFGNGITSTAVQPGVVVFQPNPTFRDTTYIITLTVFSPCDTFTISKSVRVKSKPKVLFTPNNSVGCSPMHVIFNNTSSGLNSTYTWNFGDGSAPIITTVRDTIGHTFYTAVRDTFFIKLVAVNECGADSLSYAIVVSPNTIFLDFAVNGNEQSGCSPHVVNFINNSAGASSFTWDFGDGTIINTTNNIDTIQHLFLQPGTYNVHLRATNGCSDTTATETVIVYPKPEADFSANTYYACQGANVQFNNLSIDATSYLWEFGDGNASALTNPDHAYSSPGVYTVKLSAFRFNGPGSVCTDTISKQIQIVATLPGWFTATDTASNCAPLTVTFTNQQTPSVNANWNFGDGTTGNGDVITHTFTIAGTYLVTLTAVSPGGCTYITTRTVKTLGPNGTFNYSSGYLCNSRPATFQVNGTNIDTIFYDFGDGQTLTTTSNLVFHSYSNGGIYIPSVILKNTAGCIVPLTGTDTIKVDKIKAGFTSVVQQNCGLTVVNFADTSIVFFGENNVQWDFGDGTNGTGSNTSHSYAASGLYTVRLIIFSNSGCSDTVTRQLNIHVNSIPVAEILAPATGCARQQVLFSGNIQSIDPVSITQWSVSNGVSGVSNPFNFESTQPGTYSVRLIAGTSNGCYDTANANIVINPSPTVNAPNNINICRGNSVQLNATGVGVTQYTWTPNQGLSCSNCQNPLAAPLITTPYILQGTNSFSCSDYDTTVVTVIQPFDILVSSNDSICIGESTQLVASRATTYNWTPAAGLSSTTISNPVASPTATTVYRVVGYDGFNCFTDTAFVTIGVGQYPTVLLGPDVTLATGTQLPLASTVTNGPIRTWTWTPSTDLSCTTCSLPIANIKKDIAYAVKATTAYGCSASDTIVIKTFCEQAQVFIPNAFTPDNDGVNDILMVRAKGIAMVKSFRIFNRWGEVVFEKANFSPNDPMQGWDGRIKGKIGEPAVFVYTAEVICENGSTYTYKGNVSIIK